MSRSYHYFGIALSHFRKFKIPLFDYPFLILQYMHIFKRLAFKFVSSNLKLFHFPFNGLGR